MLKYVDTLVSFQEIPDEITLCINISNCPCACSGCHSAYLAEDIGTELTIETLHKLVRENRGITCVCFMGGDRNPELINQLASSLRLISWASLKVGWYSGRQYIPEEISLRNFDYVKLGPYIEELGGLRSKTTNQVMFQVDHINEKDFITDITSKFWK